MNHFPRGRLAGEFYDDGRKLVTLRPFQYVDSEYGIDVTVPALSTTDFSSVPRLFWGVFAATDFPAAGAVHDHVFRHPPEGWSRENCDWCHWRLLRLLGCPAWKAEVVFQVLSKASRGAWNRYREMEQTPLRSLMTDTPIADSLKNLDALPVDEFSAGVAVDKDDVGATIEGNRDFGKPGGWSASVSASWWKAKGYVAAAKVLWKGKP